ncbi:hypothetical protein JCM8097_004094 [Rhodosporidiobolus ruineniae]
MSAADNAVHLVCAIGPFAILHLPAFLPALVLKLPASLRLIKALFEGGLHRLSLGQRRLVKASRCAARRSSFCTEIDLNLQSRPLPFLLCLDELLRTSSTLETAELSPHHLSAAQRDFLRDDLALKVLQQPRRPYKSLILPPHLARRLAYSDAGPNAANGGGQRVTKVVDAVVNRLFLSLTFFFPSLDLALIASEPISSDILSSPERFAEECLGFPRPSRADLAPFPLTDLTSDPSFQLFLPRLVDLLQFASSIGVEDNTLARQFRAMSDLVEAEQAADKGEEMLLEAVLDAVIEWKAGKVDAAKKET